MKITIRWPLIVGFLSIVWITHFISLPISPYLHHPKERIYTIQKMIIPFVLATPQDHIALLESYLASYLLIYPDLFTIKLGYPKGVFIGVERSSRNGPLEFHSKMIMEQDDGGLRTTVIKRNDQYQIVGTKDIEDAVTVPFEEPWYLAAIQREQNSRPAFGHLMNAGVQMITVSVPISGKDGILKAVMALEYRAQPIRTKATVMEKTAPYFNMIGMTLIAILLAFLFSLGITRPLLDLKEEAYSISHLDFDKSPYSGSIYKEIHAISETFSLMKESIKIAQRRFRNIFEHIQDVYFETTTDGTFVEISPSIQHHLGYGREEIIGKKTDVFFSVQNNTSDYMMMLKDNGKVKDYEICFKDRNGSLHYFSLNAVMVKKTGELPGKIIGSMRDINDRKKADQELERYRSDLELLVKKRTSALEVANQELLKEIESRQRTEMALRDGEEKYKSIVENILEAYIEIDAEGRITFVNDATCKMVRYSRDDLIGKSSRQIISRETSGEVDRVIKEIHETAKSRQINNFMIIRNDNHSIILEVSISLIKGQNNEPVGFRFMGRDITFRIEAEREKKMLEDQLHQAQRLEAIGTLAGGIAHDFNNLLMGIQGNLSLLYLNIDDNSPIYENLKTIESCVDSGANLTRQLLGFARGGKYVVTTIDMNKIVQNTSSLFGRTKKEIRIHGNYQNNLWNVKADRSQLEQVLVNIYVNAWQAMPDGSGDIYLQTENVILGEKYVRPYDVKAGKYVKISIRDTGTGMEEETMQRIFEPFFTTKKLGRGTGLGLASAFGIIKNHGGIIDVESKPSRGTTFFIYLPASSRPVSRKDEKPDQPIAGNESILVVDDESFIVKSLKDMLGDLGYTIYTAHGGNEAIEIFKEHKDDINLVILDLIMPDLGGKETFEILKEIRSSIKILLSSGYSFNSIAEDILKQSCDGFIQKPVNIAVLSRKIREILDK